jgi:hypothetical protein
VGRSREPSTDNSGKSNKEPVKILETQEPKKEKRKQIPDIDELDIKNQKFSKLEEKSREFDFFKDMAPVIQKTSVHVLEQELTNGTSENPEKSISVTESKLEAEEPTIQVNNKLFEMKLEDVANEQGWDDDTDW